MTDHAEWVDVESITHPTERLVEVYRDHWWATNAAGQVCLWHYGPRGREISPQCNTNPAVLDRHSKRLEGSAGTKVFLPLAFIPHRCES